MQANELMEVQMAHFDFTVTLPKLQGCPARCDSKIMVQLVSVLTSFKGQSIFLYIDTKTKRKSIEEKENNLVKMRIQRSK